MGYDEAFESGDTRVIVFDHKSGEELFRYSSTWLPGNGNLLSRGARRFKVKKSAFFVHNQALVHLMVKEIK